MLREARRAQGYEEDSRLGSQIQTCSAIRNTTAERQREGTVAEAQQAAGQQDCVAGDTRHETHRSPPRPAPLAAPSPQPRRANRAADKPDRDVRSEGAVSGRHFHLNPPCPPGPPWSSPKGALISWPTDPPDDQLAP